MKRKVSISFILMAVIFSAVITPVSAKESENEPIYYETTRLVEEGEDYAVYETDIVLANSINVSKENINEPVQARNWVGYSIKNLKTSGSAYANRNYVVASDDVWAGTSYKFKLKASYSTTIDGVMSISASYINGKLGRSNTATVSMSKEWNYTCPSKNGSKTVKYADVTYYPKFQKYTFDEYFINAKTGNGTAVVLVGSSQVVTLKYK